ncbi:SH3 domain and tetratricopeptide repeat-containing protein 1 isoform X2 [Carettochelys insculpta]|uniref:SH3 domain and tetratricopeptide repeat-containing protein 1 isoform X2 n=1 Tax=Carettochelys insculpta TaxID=44489 RepID=UPI003EBC5694
MELPAAAAVECNVCVFGLHTPMDEEGFCSSASYLERKQHNSWEGNKQQQGRNESDCTRVAANTAISNMEEKVALEQKLDSFQNNCLNTSSKIPPSATKSFPTDISLKLITVKRKSGLPDPRLQGELRGRLRLLENDSREVMAVFSELSARLLSIHSEQDLIVVTFKTFEEIWKFLTYYSLEADEDNQEGEAGIDICINEEFLNLMYKGLLIQEGTFFVLCPDNIIREAAAADMEVKLYQENRSVTEGIPGESLVYDLTLLSKAATEPLIPFHQWFLRIYSDPINYGSKMETKCSKKIATGSSQAVISYESAVPEEISFQSGDKIEIIGYFIECLEWFVGRHTLSGQMGFVKTSHVTPDLSGTEEQSLEFLDDEEKLFFAKAKNIVEEDVVHLLKQTSNTEVCTVYRLDRLEELEFQNPQEQEIQHPSSDTDSSRMREMVEEFLKKCKDFQPKETYNQGNDFPSSSNQQPCSLVEEARFCIQQDDEDQEPGISESLLLFLNSKEYEVHFKNLYDFSFPFLNSTFYGYSSEEELVGYFGLAREAAKKANLPWALTRLCFLLGRLSVRKLKFSQARVYFEEALGAIRGHFGDLHLVVALYTNLTAIYLKQKNKEKCAHIFDKVTSLLMGIPSYICSTDMESDILRYALKKTILSQSKPAEARACFLLAKHYTKLKKCEEALPFLERLQLLNNDLNLQNSSMSVDCYFKLGESYNQKCLPHIVLSCIKVASSQGLCTLTDFLTSIDLVTKNAPNLHRIRKAGQMLPSQMAPYLRQALSSAYTNGQQKLCSTIYLSLSQLYSHHRQYGEAIVYMKKVLDFSTSAQVEETINHLVSLAWLYILHRQNTVALSILNAILDSSLSSPQQLGVIYNMTAIALRQTNNIKQAAVSYYKALHISEEMDLVHNHAIVLANFGTLCLHSGANCLAEHYYVQAVKLFSGLPSLDFGHDFTQVLLQLGSSYANGSHKKRGRFYYEWALWLAMARDHLESQLQAVQLLCQFYTTVVPDEAQCVIYNEYQLSLARKLSDKVLEGQILETISQLYLSIGTERAYISALEYTKRSLGIFIDLQKKEKEAYAWLQAGKIYYILRQNELVDLYIQVAQDAALCNGDPNLGMELFEAAGDIFFSGTWEREKAVSFYRDRALPLAIKTGSKMAELRLCNKLVQLLVNLQNYEDSLEYAQISLTLSVNLGNQLNERIAYHRLAVIHHRLGHCELAEHFYLKALSLCSSPLEFDEEALYYVQVYLILGDMIFYDLKDPFDAAGYYHLALAAAMDLGNKKAQLKIYTRLAMIYHNFLMDREMSLFFYQRARIFATELNVRRINLAPDQYYKTAPSGPVKNIV